MRDLLIAVGVALAAVTDLAALLIVSTGKTNILALNAAVEAARAGEQGRGFIGAGYTHRPAFPLRGSPNSSPELHG